MRLFVPRSLARRRDLLPLPMALSLLQLRISLGLLLLQLILLLLSSVLLLLLLLRLGGKWRPILIHGHRHRRWYRLSSMSIPGVLLHQLRLLCSEITRPIPTPLLLRL